MSFKKGKLSFKILTDIGKMILLNLLFQTSIYLLKNAVSMELQGGLVQAKVDY